MKQMLKILLVLVGSFLVILFTQGIHNPKYSGSTVDVSWPNCVSKPHNAYAAGIIGVTGGLDFRPNPCLASETTWLTSYSLYMNTGYPGRFYGIKFASSPKHCASKNYSCLGYNYGYNAAQYAIKYSYSQAAHSTDWWIDVEADNSWTLHPMVNRAVISGAIAAIKQIPFISQIGIYSASDQWNFLTNSWHNKRPVWLATGAVTKEMAKDACQSSSFTGGTILMSQYTQLIDIDLFCTKVISF